MAISKRTVVGWFTRKGHPIPITVGGLQRLQERISERRNKPFYHVVAEATPSTSIQGLEWINSAGTRTKQEFLDGAMSILFDAQGRNELLNKIMPNLISLARKGAGTWEGATNPNLISSIMKLVGTRKTGPLKEKIRRVVDDYACALGYVLKQDMVPWFRPDPNIPKGKAAQGIWIRKVGNKPITQEEADGMKVVLKNVAPGLDFTLLDGSLSLLNFTGMSNREFDKSVLRAAKVFARLSKENIRVKRFKAEANYVENNWKENPNGEGYRRRLGETYGQDLLDWLDRKQKEVGDYAKRFTASHRKES